MLKAISNLGNTSKSKNVSFAKQSNAIELPYAKNLKNLKKDTFTRNEGPVCGIDLSFEDF